MSRLLLRSLARAICLLALASSVFAADAEHGKAIFAPCAACHTDRADALGPSLKGIVGRKSAALDDFRYSNPMKRANLVWDEDNLRAYIRDPQGKVFNRTFLTKREAEAFQDAGFDVETVA